MKDRGRFGAAAGLGAVVAPALDFALGGHGLAVRETHRDLFELTRRRQ